MRYSHTLLYITAINAFARSTLRTKEHMAESLCCVQAIALKECDVYSYKGDGDMDPLSESAYPYHYTLQVIELCSCNLLSNLHVVLQARKGLSGASTIFSTTGN